MRWYAGASFLPLLGVTMDGIDILNAHIIDNLLLEYNSSVVGVRMHMANKITEGESRLIKIPFHSEWQ